MSQHKWKFGDWARLPNGVIARFVSEVNFCPAAEIYRYFLRKCGHIYHETEYEHLPDCDSFDWQPPKPIEPPEGYRLLSQGEKIRPCLFSKNLTLIVLETGIKCLVKSTLTSLCLEDAKNIMLLLKKEV